MKNQMKVLLRGGVLMLAAVFAFAFTEPVPTELYGQDPTTGIWHDVSGIQPSSTTYTCDNGGAACLRDEPSTSGQIVSMGSDQLFVKRGNLPIAD
ncbi:hypothetical protein [Rhodonellum sp.]|uniref:hypothetical protein n=1 Tax=Rhodonellum sp. TaxID=2231180 RepID=UPI00271580FF|nr:hypothetical protein [Rhodonellum sp.]MDO9553273.1 hypothetical protein [Rhodonellum sp.]